jgi:cytochrome o ubiquinol oxidase subunit 1
VLGLMGMTRRMQHYDNLAWQPWLAAAAVGAIVILAGIACQVIQLVVSIRDRKQHRDLTGDPWHGRTLEWSTASPPPAWNFAVLPEVSAIDAWWGSKQHTRATPDQSIPTRTCQPIEVPKNSAIGVVTAFFAVVIGFALIWHIWWLVVLGLFGVFATILVFAFRDAEEIEISAEQVARFERHAQTEVA